MRKVERGLVSTARGLSATSQRGSSTVKHAAILKRRHLIVKRDIVIESHAAKEKELADIDGCYVIFVTGFFKLRTPVHQANLYIENHKG